MRNVDKQTRGEIEAAATRVTEAAGAVTAAHEAIEGALEELMAPLASAVEAYNDAVSAYNELIEQASSDVQAYMDDRSDRWREGENGERYQTWVDALDGAKLEEVDVPDAPTVELPDVREPEVPPLSIDEF